MHKNYSRFPVACIGRLVKAGIHPGSIARLKFYNCRVSPGVGFKLLTLRFCSYLEWLCAGLVFLEKKLGGLVAVGIKDGHCFFIRR